MDQTSKSLLSWKAKMDDYYKSSSREQLRKDLTKAGFKVADKKLK